MRCFHGADTSAKDREKSVGGNCCLGNLRPAVGTSPKCHQERCLYDGGAYTLLSGNRLAIVPQKQDGAALSVNLYGVNVYRTADCHLLYRPFFLFLLPGCSYLQLCDHFAETVSFDSVHYGFGEAFKQTLCGGSEAVKNTRNDTDSTVQHRADFPPSDIRGSLFHALWLWTFDCIQRYAAGDEFLLPLFLVRCGGKPGSET